jgi:hypothetical protein
MRERSEYKSCKFCQSIRDYKPNFQTVASFQTTRIRIYKTLARPVLSCGSEAWTIRRTDGIILISAEMRFLRRTAGYTRWGHKINEDILTELQMSQITEFIHQ